MQKYRIYEYKKFRKKFKKLPIIIQKRFKKQIEKLKCNPYFIGKPLGDKDFRELKNKGYRLYYYILNRNIIIILIDISNKKDQQGIINNFKNVKNNFNKIFKYEK